MRSEFRISWTVFACLSPLPFVYSVPLLVPPFVRMSVVYVSLHPSPPEERGNRGEWVTNGGGKERRTERSFIPHSLRRSFPRSYVTRLVTLTSFLGADWVEWEEATRIEVKRAEFQPFVDSVLLTLSPLASFACHSLRSLGGAGPEDGSERGWMACSRAERTENRSERLTHGINVSPLVVMFRPPCVVPSVSTSSGRVFHPLPTSSGRNERREWRTVDGGWGWGG